MVCGLGVHSPKNQAQGQGQELKELCQEQLDVEA